MTLRPPGPGVDATPLLSAALAERGLVELAAGDYELHTTTDRYGGLQLRSATHLRSVGGVVRLIPRWETGGSAIDVLKVGGGDEAVRSVTMRGLTIYDRRERLNKEQGHGIAVAGSELGPVEGARVIGCRIVAMTGDAVYFGSWSSEVQVDDLVADCARGAVTIAGAGPSHGERPGIWVRGVRRVSVAETLNADPLQAYGPVVDFEPSNGASFFFTRVRVEDCSGPGNLHVEHVRGGLFRRLDVGTLKGGNMDGCAFDRCHLRGETIVGLDPARPRLDGDGNGYTIRMYGGATRVRFRGCIIDTPAGGAGTFYSRTPSNQDAEVRFVGCVRRYHPDAVRADLVDARKDRWTDIEVQGGRAETLGAS